MGSEEMKHKTSAEYVTLLSFFDSTPSDLKKILLEQPIQHTDDNESRSLIFPTTVDSRLADTSLLRPPDNADNNQPSPPPPPSSPAKHIKPGAWPEIEDNAALEHACHLLFPFFKYGDHMKD